MRILRTVRWESRTGVSSTRVQLNRLHRVEPHGVKRPDGRRGDSADGNAVRNRSEERSKRGEAEGQPEEELGEESFNTPGWDHSPRGVLCTNPLRVGPLEWIIQACSRNTTTEEEDAPAE